MSIKQRLKQYPSLYLSLMRGLNSINYFNIRFNLFFPSYHQSDSWKKRTETVLESPDNKLIPRVDNAGKLLKNYQIMHNGLKITLGSYYDYGNTILLQQNKGVHEPQEEYVFQEVLKQVPAKGSMMELGSYWAFYSMWFASHVKDARCYMVEPDPHKINFGQLNFKLNKLKGHFLVGFIADLYKKGSIPQYSVDYLMEHLQLGTLNILHSDIQGYEVMMLEGSVQTLSAKKVDFLFISTHSNDLHNQCLDLLNGYGYRILCEANLDESYAVDGLIVAASPAVTIKPLTISKRNK